ncbi:unnamed protein product [Ectocarpus sp. 12 AP-2014]
MTRVYSSLWGKLLVMAMLLTSVAGGKSSQPRKPTPPKTCAPYHPGIQGNVGEGSQGIICCPLECRQCGGVGCRKNQPRGLSGDDCCVSGVLQSQGDCSDRGAKAPCIIQGPKSTSSPQKDPAPAPTPPKKPRKPSRKPRKPSRKPRKPSRKPRKPSPPRKPTPPQKTCAPYHPGMKGNVGQNDNGIVCCPLACGTCGGPECASNKRDGLDCCIDDIIRTCDPCGRRGTRPPCVIDEPTQGRRLTPEYATRVVIWLSFARQLISTTCCRLGSCSGCPHVDPRFPTSCHHMYLVHHLNIAPIFTPNLNTKTCTDSRADSRADPSTDPSTDPGTDPSTDACADSRADPSTYPSTDACADSRTDSRADPSTYPSTYPSTDGCADRRANAGANAGID